MAADVFFGFDSSDPDDRKWIDRIIANKQGKATGVPVDLVRRINNTRVGKFFVDPLAKAMTPGKQYSAQQLAELLGTGWTPKKVASKFNVMGRPEKKFGVRIFQRPAPGTYAIAEQMKEAILDPLNRSHHNGVSRSKIMGHTATSILRWLGHNGYAFDDAKKVCVAFKAEDMSDSTIRAQLSAGRKNKRGGPAKLSDDAIKTIAEVLK